ncbi:MAG: phage tail tape measure protein [Microbacteriaceae bacterium]
MELKLGSLVFNLTTAGDQIFNRNIQESKKSAEQLGTTTKKTAKETEELGTKSKEAAPKVKSLKEEVKELSDANSNAGRAAKEVGITFMAIGASAIASVGLAAKAAIDWESAWAGVQKTNDGTSEQMEKLQKELRGMTRELPASHQEIAAVAEAAGQLGIEVDNVAAFTRAMIDLGETTNLSSEEAAMELAKFMNVMGTSQKQVSNLGSAVVDLGNNYATTERDIVAMSSRLAGAGNQVGLSEGQVLGLAAALSSVGIEADAGGTAFSKVMIDIASSVDKGGERLDKFANIAGVSADEFAKKWKTDPGAALALFVKGLSNAEQQGTSTFAMLEELGISEVRLRDALLKSAAASDLFTDAMGRGNDAFDENNALAKEAAIRYETVQAKLDIARNSINDAAISFGSVFLPILADMAEGVATFAGWMADLPEPVQTAITLTTLLAGAALLAGGAFLTAVPKIVQYRAAIATLNAETPKAMARLKGFGAAAAGVLAITFAAGISKWSRELMGASKSAEQLQRTLKEVDGAQKAVSEVKQGGLLGLMDGGIRANVAIKSLLNDTMGLSSAMADFQNTDLGNLVNFATLGMFNNGLGDTKKNIEELDQAMANMVAGGNAKAAEEAFAELIKHTDGSEESIQRVKELLPGYTGAIEDAGRGTNKAADAANDAADAYLAQSKEVEDLNKKLKQLIDRINEANGVGQDAVTKNAKYQEALADVRKEISELEKGLDETTLSGAQNAAMLADLASQSQDAAAAMYEQDLKTMGSAEATELYKKRLEEGRETVLQFAKGLETTSGQAEALTDKIYAIPGEKEIQITADIAAAQSEIDRFIRMNENRSLGIVVGGRVGGTGIIREADGGKVQFFANGGENRIAQYAKAGDWRVWAEPETGGEYYIPMAPAKRQRSLAIASQMVDEMGYTMQPKGSLNGVQISGTLDLGNGLTGLIRGVINEADEETAVLM